MAIRIWMDGTIHDEQASVSVFDRGFLYGDSVYEVTRTSGGVPVDWDRHMQRLTRSALALSLQIPEQTFLHSATRETLLEAQNPESYIRWMVTRGSGEIGLDLSLAGKPRLVIMIKPLKLLSSQVYKRGLRAAWVSVKWGRAVDPMVKSGNYLTNILALAEAQKKGCEEAILCSPQGHVLEATTSNVFCVHGNHITTPALGSGLLDGITRGRIIELLRDIDIQVAEKELYKEDFVSADEVFATSSVRGVMPIVAIDDRPIGKGIPGLTSCRVHETYERFLSRVATEPFI